MRKSISPIYTLRNFEGPLDFLLQLVQKNEVDISEIELRLILKQYTDAAMATGADEDLDQLSDRGLDRGAEFIGTASSL